MDHRSDDDTNFDNAITQNGSSSAGVGNAGTGGGGGGGFHSIRDRFRLKRHSNASTSYLPRTSKTAPSNGSSLDRQFKTGRSHHHHHHSRSVPRKMLLFPVKERSWFYLCILLVIFVFALASIVLQSSILSVLRQGGGSERGKWLWSVRDDLKLGTSLHFVPRRRLGLRDRLDPLRNQTRIGIRPPRIALVCKYILMHVKIKHFICKVLLALIKC